jgi:hypothetical protein
MAPSVARVWRDVREIQDIVARPAEGRVGTDFLLAPVIDWNAPVCPDALLNPPRSVEPSWSFRHGIRPEVGRRERQLQ